MQDRLFMVPLPGGFAYHPDFLTPEEEQELLGYIEDLPFEHPTQEGYAAKRRVIGFGWTYDVENERLVPGPPLPPFLQPLARKAAKWLDVRAARVVEALITEYTPGSAIGWHRDNERFEHIVGISLLGPSLLRLRPISSKREDKRRTAREIQSLLLAPRSAYVMRGVSRWDFQHSIPKVPSLRYSITLRTLPDLLYSRYGTRR